MIFFILGVCSPLSVENGRIAYDKSMNEDGKYPTATTANTLCDRNYALSSNFPIRHCNDKGYWINEGNLYSPSHKYCIRRHFTTVLKNMYPAHK